MTLPLRKRKRLLRVAILTGAIAIFVFFFYSLIRFAALRLFAYDFSSHEIGVLLAAAALAVLLYKPFDYLTLLFFKDVVFRSSGKVDSALQNLARAARTIQT